MAGEEATEQHRHECECRDWLRRGYTTPEKINRLRERIETKRGKEAADRLIEGMRTEYKRMRSAKNSKVPPV